MVCPAGDAGFVQNPWPQKFHTCGWEFLKKTEFSLKHFSEVGVPAAVMGPCLKHSVKNAVCIK